MPYSVALTAEAEDDLDRINEADPPLATFILDQLDRLAANPRTLSTTGHPFPDAQRFSFWSEGPYARRHVHIFFQYGQDEMTLWITGIAQIAY